MIKYLRPDKVKYGVDVLLVTDESVCRAEENAARKVGRGISVRNMSSQDVTDGGDAKEEGAVEAAHCGDEDDGTVDRVDRGILEGLDVCSACPAKLLE